MSNETTQNPVLLWGDMGPDVYKLSQIYDPRNDRYVTTQDTSVAADKDYYERLSLILTQDTVVDTTQTYYKRVVDAGTGAVTYTKVTPRGNENPSENGWYQNAGGKIYVFSKVTPQGNENPYTLMWYEVNPDSVDTCGKYVPAVDSLVVVDIDGTDCSYKIENKYKARMLLAVKSVDAALNVTFVTVRFGTDTDETARAIDYGNERFMLFFDRKAAGGGNILLTPDRKMMLYGTKSYAYRLSNEAHGVISKNLPAIQTNAEALIPFVRATAKRVMITKGNYADYQSTLNYLDVLLDNGFQRLITLSADPATMIPALDLVFKTGKTYYAKDNDSYTTLVAGVDFQYGDQIRVWEDENDKIICRPLAQNPLTDAWDGDLIGRTAYVHDDSEQAASNVFIAESCYLKSALSIADGETVTASVYELDETTKAASLVLTLTLTAKEATALDITDVTTRQIVKFDVELNGDDNTGDVWYLQQGQDWNEVFNFTPRISFDDGSAMTVAIDNRCCYKYGFENINSTAVGREYQVLFKFYPHKSLHVDWEKIGFTPTKNFLTCRKTVKIVNNLSYRIRKISLLPAWDHDQQKYHFFYMTFRNDFVSPEIERDDLETKYTISTYTKTTDTVASKYTSGEHEGVLKRYYRKQNSGYFVDLNLALNTPINFSYPVYERTVQPSTSIYDVQYMNANGDVQYIAAAAAGSNFGVVQHAMLNKMETDRNYGAQALYSQAVAFELQNMMIESAGRYKWLIGDDLTGYTEITLPYGKDPRPMIVCTPEGNTQTCSYMIPKSVFSSVDKFLDAFYTAAQPPYGVAEDGTVVDDAEFTPTHFFIRALNDDSACSGFVEISSDGLYNAVSMTGGGFAAPKIINSKTVGATVGGAIPVEYEDAIYAQGDINIHGTVVVEFVRAYRDPDDITKIKYLHLYAVPVETVLPGWIEE